MSARTEPTIRHYDETRDLEDVTRVWCEVGWADTDAHAALVEPFHRAGRTLVAEVGGAVEAAAQAADGTIRHGEATLPFAGITAVAVGHVLRHRGVAGRLTARLLADSAEAGAVVAGLGMFEQGFYDRLGFGSLSYIHAMSFDPRALQVEVPAAIPVHVTADDWAEVHACVRPKQVGHGNVVLEDPRLLQAELGWSSPSFGLGYRDADGTLTHVVYGEAKGEHGPYRVTWMGYETSEQLLELLGLLRSLGDQVDTVEIREPRELQMQDLLTTPLRDARRAKTEHHATAWTQLRLLDVPGAVSATSFDRDPVRFNLVLDDPATRSLPDGGWRGAGGSWVVELGPTSSAEPGEAPDLPTLRGGIGPFSRVLFGVRDASVLARTTDLEASAELLAALDRVIDVREPRFDWEF